MMGNRNGFLAFLFAMTTLLICSNPTSAFVNQTSNSATPFSLLEYCLILTHLIFLLFSCLTLLSNRRSDAAANVSQGMVLFFRASDP